MGRFVKGLTLRDQMRGWASQMQGMSCREEHGMGAEGSHVFAMVRTLEQNENRG